MAENPRGTKRKRPAAPEVDIQTILTRKLHHDIREVTKAAKKAKTFETQKVVKQLKSSISTAKNDPAELQSMLDALKLLDHDSIATTALQTKLHKDKFLSNNDHIKLAIASELNIPPLVPAIAGSPAAKVQSRLLSSKLLSSEIVAVIRGLHNIINPPSKDLEKEEEPDSSPQPSKKEDETKPVTHLSADENSDREEDDAAGWESGELDAGDEDLAEEGWDSGSVAGSQSEDEDDSSEDEDLRPARPKKLKKQDPVTASTFLPSLSVGFIPGSDDSDISDADLDDDVAPRKNRRGQRARRAIWEKKFGKGANHKKKEQDDFEERRKRREARAKEQPQGVNRTSQARPSSKFNPQASDAGWNRRSTAESKPEPELHPSWQAKKKQKETEKTGIVPSKGKKIKFD